MIKMSEICLLRATRLGLVSLALLAWVSTGDFLQAQRRNHFGASIELVGAADDNPSMTRNRLNQILDRKYAFSWSAYPSVNVQSDTTRSSFSLDYTFGYERYESKLDIESLSHMVGADYQVNLSERWKLSLGDSYTRSPDFTGFLAFRGVAFTPEGIIYDYEPIAVRRDGFQNSARFSAEYATSERSSLTFRANHSYRDYEDVPGFNHYLDTHHRYSGGAEFRRKLSERTSWVAGYNGDYYNFEQYHEARTHDAFLGIDHQLRPSLSVSLRGGPSYADPSAPSGGGSVVVGPGGTELEVRLKSYAGYNLEAALTKVAPRTNVSLFARRSNGSNAGIGSISTNYLAGVSLSQILARKVTAKFSVIGYDYKGRLDNPFKSRGLSSTVSLEFLLSRFSSLSVGANYHDQDSDRWYNSDRRRIYVALRFFAPDRSSPKTTP